MLLGVPVIATLVGGTPTILQNNIEGSMVQDGDPIALAGTIKELAGSPEKQRTFSANARQKATARHNPKSVVERLMVIYNSIINS
jgi:glycosyltransferase involved in cell wall biosynthesis